MVHGDDFLFTGPKSEIDWVVGELTCVYECKVQRVGRRTGLQREARLLGRVIRLEADRLEYEPDPTHAELAIAAMGLTGAKPVSSPGKVVEAQHESSKALRAKRLAGEDPDSKDRGFPSNDQFVRPCVPYNQPSGPHEKPLARLCALAWFPKPSSSTCGSSSG